MAYYAFTLSDQDTSEDQETVSTTDERATPFITQLIVPSLGAHFQLGELWPQTKVQADFVTSVLTSMRESMQIRADAQERWTRLFEEAKSASEGGAIPAKLQRDILKAKADAQMLPGSASAAVIAKANEAASAYKGPAPILAIVDRVYELEGKYMVCGKSFGAWEENGQAIATHIPESLCITTWHWDSEELAEHVEEIEAELMEEGEDGDPEAGDPEQPGSDDVEESGSDDSENEDSAPDSETEPSASGIEALRPPPGPEVS